MRIGIFDPAFRVPRANATTHEVMLRDDARLLAAAGVEVTVLTYGADGDADGVRLLGLGERGGVASRLTDASRRRIPLLSNLPEPGAWRRAARRVGADAPDVWYSGGTPFTAIPTLRLARATRRPFVHALTHVAIGWDWWREERDLFKPDRLPASYLAGHAARNAVQEAFRRPWIARRALRAASRVLAAWPGVAEEAKRLDPGLRVDLLPPAALPPPPPPPLPAEPTFAYTGHLWQGRGVLDALRAVALVRRERPDVRFVVAASNVQEVTERFFERIVRDEGLAPAVLRLGVAKDLRADVIWPSRALLLPYRDNPSVKLVEALAAGRPVVTTRVAGMEAALADDAEAVRLVDPGDVRGLADAMLALAGDDALARRTGERGRRLAASTFSPERRLKGLLAALGEASA